MFPFGGEFNYIEEELLAQLVSFVCKNPFKVTSLPINPFDVDFINACDD
jgi:hypothetical protein